MAKLERVVIPAVVETRVIEEEKEVFKLELSRNEIETIRTHLLGRKTWTSHADVMSVLCALSFYKTL